MQNLAELLARFQRIENPAEIKKKITTVVEGVVSFKIAEGSVKVSEGKVYIKAHPVQKNLIFVKKDEVLSAINSNFPSQRVDSVVFL
ncbi:MAG TPA: hypothetical protein VGE62_03445 [Candidatus Paceibacterota bacterium]